MKCQIALLLLTSIVCLTQAYREHSIFNKPITKTRFSRAAQAFEQIPDHVIPPVSSNTGIKNDSSGRMFLMKIPKFRSISISNRQPVIPIDGASMSVNSPTSPTLTTT